MIADAINRSEFTFQYGSNQIGDADVFAAVVVAFTFQYGSNQILRYHLGFQLNRIFTFQYGSNQITSIIINNF